MGFAAIDLAPPPAEACIAQSDLSAATRGATFFVVAGPPSDLADFLSEASKNKAWVVVSRSKSESVETVMLRGSLQMPYREIGGLIFLAQTKKLVASFATYPAICEVENNAQKN
jgi:hypothetical protein